MKKKILISCFFVSILLLVPFTAITGGAINIKSMIKKTSKITNEEIDLSNIIFKMKDESAEQMLTEIEVKIVFLIQNLPEGLIIPKFETTSFYWLDCIFLFILREIAWWRFSESPANSEEAAFWYDMYQYLDQKYTEKCKNSSLSDSKTNSIGCGCMEKYSNPNSANLDNLEKLTKQIKETLDYAFKEYYKYPIVNIIYKDVSKELQETPNNPDFCQSLNEMIDETVNKTQSFLNEDNIIYAWVLMFITTPIVVAYYVLCELEIPHLNLAFLQPLVRIKFILKMKTILSKFQIFTNLPFLKVNKI